MRTTIKARQSEQIPVKHFGCCDIEERAVLLATKDGVTTLVARMIAIRDQASFIGRRALELTDT